jgi:hypothetical protein
MRMSHITNRTVATTSEETNTTKFARSAKRNPTHSAPHPTSATTNWATRLHSGKVLAPLSEAAPGPAMLSQAMVSASGIKQRPTHSGGATPAFVRLAHDLLTELSARSPCHFTG